MESETPKKTQLEQGTEISGTLTSDRAVVIHGRFSGELQAPELTVTETGAVEGKIKTDKLASSGTLSGDFEAEEISLSGTVLPNTRIRAHLLEVGLMRNSGPQEVILGTCQIEAGEDPLAESLPESKNSTTPHAEESATPATNNDRDGKQAAPDAEEQTATQGTTADQTQNTAESASAKSTDTDTDAAESADNATESPAAQPAASPKPASRSGKSARGSGNSQRPSGGRGPRARKQTVRGQGPQANAAPNDAGASEKSTTSKSSRSAPRD